MTSYFISGHSWGFCLLVSHMSWEQIWASLEMDSTHGQTSRTASVAGISCRLFLGKFYSIVDHSEPWVCACTTGLGLMEVTAADLSRVSSLYSPQLGGIEVEILGKVQPLEQQNVLSCVTVRICSRVLDSINKQFTFCLNCSFGCSLFFGPHSFPLTCYEILCPIQEKKKKKGTICSKRISCA